MAEKDYKPTSESTVNSVPKRVAFIKLDSTASVQRVEEKMVMSFPSLVVRGAICFQIVVIVLAVISLLFDAPLKHIADPLHTESPAKAPWYFLGLQELLHYFPPVVGGVLIPTLVIVALIVIPYFKINIDDKPLWDGNTGRTFTILTVAVFVLAASMLFLHAWSISLPAVGMYGLMLIPRYHKKKTGFVGLLGKATLAQWIMTWFMIQATILIIIGVFFRGPFWKWSWPWIEGIY